MKQISLGAILAAACAWSAVAPAPATAQESAVVFPEGSRVGMVPFAGSKPATGFQGFVDEATKRSVMIIEMPAEARSVALEDFVAAEDMAAEGIKQVARRNFELAEGSAKVKAIEVRATQTAAGRTFPKCMVVFHASDFTALISAQMPDDKSGDACALIKGLQIRGALSEGDIMGALPFTLADRGGLKPWRSFGGSGVLLTDSADGQPSDDAATMIVARAIAERAVPPKEQLLFSEQSLKAAEALASAKILSKRMVTGAKVPTSEVMAEQQGKRIVQWIQFHPDGYTVRLVGEAPAARFDALLPGFIRIRDGVTVK